MMRKISFLITWITFLLLGFSLNIIVTENIKNIDADIQDNEMFYNEKPGINFSTQVNVYEGSKLKHALFSAANSLQNRMRFNDMPTENSHLLAANMKSTSINSQSEFLNESYQFQSSHSFLTSNKSNISHYRAFAQTVIPTLNKIDDLKKMIFSTQTTETEKDVTYENNSLEKRFLELSGKTLQKSSALDDSPPPGPDEFPIDDSPPPGPDEIPIGEGMQILLILSLLYIALKLQLNKKRTSKTNLNA